MATYNTPQTEGELWAWWGAHQRRMGNLRSDAPGNTGERWDAVRTYGELPHLKSLEDVGGVSPTTGYARPTEEGTAGDIARHAWGRLGGPELFAAATATSSADALATDRAVRNVEGAERTGQQRRRRRPSLLTDNLDEQSLLLGGIG